MATDFFERQSRARTNTSWLIALFIIAVIAIVAAATGVTALGIHLYGEYESSSNRTSSAWGDATAAWGEEAWMGGTAPFPWWIPALVGLGTLAVIIGGSFFKVVTLRQGGGSGVAEGLGGGRVYPNATDPDHRRLLNVVEEMAIASGTPVPPVFLLDEERGINAFAAGYTPSDAVVGVTRGCVQSLTREQLQGVVAHEFSHILNGDMRLSIRLIGVLHGILLLGTLGQLLFRMLIYSGSGHRRRRSSNSDNKKGGSGVLILLAVAVTLIVLGSIGVFFGGLIRAAVSRQREYLADASAVQFTRNPGGLSGALKKIGGLAKGSTLQAPRAPEASHLFFAQGVAAGFSQWLSTHPPLDKRILAIDPTWNGVYPTNKEAKRRRDSSPASAAASSFVGSSAGESAAPASAAEERLPAEAVRESIAHIGAPLEAHRRRAAELLTRIPDALRSALHEPYEAQAVVFALVLDRDEAMRRKQIAALHQISTADMLQRTGRWFEAISKLDSRIRLPLIDISLPALRSMTDAQYPAFRRSFHALVAADQRMDLLEWTLSQILMRNLRGQFEGVPKTPTLYYGMGRLGEPCSVLLSTLAHVGHSEAESKQAFSEAARLIEEAHPRWLPKSECTLERLDAAVRKLATLSARHRKRILEAGSVCIESDGKVTAIEAELLRGIADLLTCPMPPFLK